MFYDPHSCGNFTNSCVHCKDVHGSLVRLELVKEVHENLKVEISHCELRLKTARLSEIRFFFKFQMSIFRNIQLQGAYKNMIFQLYIDGIKTRSIDLQLWIMVSCGWY